MLQGQSPTLVDYFRSSQWSFIGYLCAHKRGLLGNHFWMYEWTSSFKVKSIRWPLQPIALTSLCLMFPPVYVNNVSALLLERLHEALTVLAFKYLVFPVCGHSYLTPEETIYILWDESCVSVFCFFNIDNSVVFISNKMPVLHTLIRRWYK